MGYKLIRLEDGTLVEVEVDDNQAQEISSRFADHVDTTFEKIKPILIKTCAPISDAWKELNAELEIESAEIEIGFSFEGEGNIYITKARATSNLTVKLTLKPKD